MLSTLPLACSNVETLAVVRIMAFSPSIQDHSWSGNGGLNENQTEVPISVPKPGAHACMKLRNESPNVANRILVCFVSLFLYPRRTPVRTTRSRMRSYHLPGLLT